jgi:hypothetical protein
MKQIYFEKIPEDVLFIIIQYYITGLRHRTNIRKLRELIEFTQGEPKMILTPGSMEFLD